MNFESPAETKIEFYKIGDMVSWKGMIGRIESEYRGISPKELYSVSFEGEDIFRSVLHRELEKIFT